MKEVLSYKKWLSIKPQFVAGISRCKQHFVLWSMAFFWGLTSYGQIRTSGTLPSQINESSGLEKGRGDNAFWTFNDSGAESFLYSIDSNGNLIHKVFIESAVNKDWEEITKDKQGHLFVGDFGNNDNKREDLTIYKFNEPENQTQEISVEEISFVYEDQYQFPPTLDYMTFDCEAMFWSGGYLYLFTKNRSFPMNTHLYRVPDQPGQHVAKRIGELRLWKNELDQDPILDFWITAAAISEDEQTVALLAHNKVYLITDFKEDLFLSGEVKQIMLGHSSQKEGLCFANDSTLMITDEYKGEGERGGELYTLKLTKKVNEPLGFQEVAFSFQVYPTILNDVLFVKNSNALQVDIHVTNVQGSTIGRFKSRGDLNIDTRHWKQGFYLLSIMDINKEFLVQKKLFKF